MKLTTRAANRGLVGCHAIAIAFPEKIELIVIDFWLRSSESICKIYDISSEQTMSNQQRQSTYLHACLFYLNVRTGRQDSSQIQRVAWTSLKQWCLQPLVRCVAPALELVVFLLG